MRIERLSLLALALLGCAIRLDNTPPPAPDAGAPMALSGCTTGVMGRLVWVRLPDGRTLVVNDGNGFIAPSDAAPAADCLASATPLPTHPIVDLSALAPGDHPQPLGAVTTATDSFLYVSAARADGLSSDGIAVTRWNAAAGRFTDPVFLWTADRPSYGSGAAVDGATVYLFGGQAGEFLDASMFVARVAADQIAVPGAYQYWSGGGNWAPDPDHAVPFADGGVAPSIAWDAPRARWLLAYATPLATDITVRAGLSPNGPWSQPVTLGRCALPTEDPGSFCGDVVLYPTLSPPGATADDEIQLAQGAGSFDPPAGIAADAYATRVVHGPWPASLP